MSITDGTAHEFMSVEIPATLPAGHLAGLTPNVAALKPLYVAGWSVHDHRWMGNGYVSITLRRAKAPAVLTPLQQARAITHATPKTMYAEEAMIAYLAKQPGNVGILERPVFEPKERAQVPVPTEYNWRRLSEFERLAAKESRSKGFDMQRATWTLEFAGNVYLLTLRNTKTTWETAHAMLMGRVGRILDGKDQFSVVLRDGQRDYVVVEQVFGPSKTVPTEVRDASKELVAALFADDKEPASLTDLRSPAEKAADDAHMAKVRGNFPAPLSPAEWAARWKAGEDAATLNATGTIALVVSIDAHGFAHAQIREAGTLKANDLDQLAAVTVRALATITEGAGVRLGTVEVHHAWDGAAAANRIASLPDDDTLRVPDTAARAAWGIVT